MADHNKNLLLVMLVLYHKLRYFNLVFHWLKTTKKKLFQIPYRMGRFLSSIISRYYQLFPINRLQKLIIYYHLHFRFDYFGDFWIVICFLD